MLIRAYDLNERIELVMNVFYDDDRLTANVNITF